MQPKNRLCCVLLFTTWLTVNAKNAAFCYFWPFDTFATQHPISGSVGEIRSTTRFHEGVDIAEPNGTEIFHVSSFGNVTKLGNDFVVIDGVFKYLHITPDAQLAKDFNIGISTVGFTTVLGKINLPVAPHLHFEQSSGGLNPLDSSGLFPFSDTGNPIVESVSISKDVEPTGFLASPSAFPTHPTLGIPLVLGSMDIVGTAFDPRVNADGSAGIKGIAPYQIGFQILDSNGFPSTAENIKITFDSILNKSVPKVYLSGSDFLPVRFIYWATHHPSNGGSFNTQILADGKYRAKMVVKDIKGNAGSTDIQFVINNHGPFPLDRFPTPFQFIKQLLLDIFITWEDMGAGVTTDASFYTLKLDGSPLSLNTGVGASVKVSASTSVLEGVHTIEASAKDLGGLITTESWSFTVDVTPPTGSIFSITSPTGNPQFTNSQTVNVRVMGTDNLAGITEVFLSNDNMSFQSIAVGPTKSLDTILTWTLPFGDGLKTVYAKFRDQAGNESSPSVTGTITLDQTPPTITSQSPVSFSFINNPKPTISANYSDALSGIDTGSVSLHFDSNTITAFNGLIVTPSSASTTPVANLTDGGHSANLTVKDRAGNTAPFGLWSFNVDTLGPTVVSATASPDPAKAGPVTITVTFTDGTGIGVDDGVVPTVLFVTAGGVARGLTQTSFTGNTWTGAGTVSAGDDGSATIRVSGAKDKLGNLMAPNNNAGSFLIDTIAPDPPVSLKADDGFPSSPWKSTTVFTITWTNPPDATGISGSVFKMDAFSEEFIPQSENITKDFAGQIFDGDGNILQVRLRDGAGNADPTKFEQVFLRLDTQPPKSTTVSPSTASIAPIPVGFSSTDQPGLSGIKVTKLHFRRDANDDGFPDTPSWTAVGELSGSSGTFTFDPQGISGGYEFYTQAEDIAGNLEAAPTATTLPKSFSFFDDTPAKIVNISVPLVTTRLAEARWETDDKTTGIVEFGTTSALGFKAFSPTFSRSHRVFLVSTFPSPAIMFFRVIATNKTQLTSVSGIQTFTTPLDVLVQTDIFGVIDLSQPITVNITNPQLNFLNVNLTDDVTLSTSIVIPISVELVTGRLDGINLNMTFPPALAPPVAFLPFIVSAGGVMTDPSVTPGSSVAEMTLGQVGQEEMSGSQSKIFLGFYSLIDPVPPGSIPNLLAQTGPDFGQVTLSWTAVGDDANVGNAMQYDLRISTLEITETNFRRAPKVIQAPIPAKAGTTESIVLSGLESATTYFFAIKAVDELLNTSTTSAFANAKTLEPTGSPSPPIPSVTVVTLPPDILTPVPPVSLEVFVSTETVLTGLQTFQLSLNGFIFSTEFVVDTATRSVKLARLVMDAGGVMTDTTTTPTASLVDMTLGQVAQSTMSSPQNGLLLGYYSGIDPVPPGRVTDLAARPGPGRGEATLNWTAVGDDANVGNAMKYDLRLSTLPIIDAKFLLASTAPAPSPALGDSVQQVIVSGLADATTYFFALKVFDELLNSSLSNSTTAQTFEVAQSTDLIDGQAVVTLISNVPGLSIGISTVAPDIALATSAAAAQGLIFVSALYDINPSTTFIPGATIQFRYSDIDGADLEQQIRIYRFDTVGNQWIQLPDGPPDIANNLITAPIFSVSLFALFIQDREPPITSLQFIDGIQFSSTEGILFASTSTAFNLDARDPPLGNLSGTGVFRTEFRIDSATIPFSAFATPFFFPAGFHFLQFRSIDNAKNEEKTKSLLVGMDTNPPRITVSFDEPFRRLVSGVVSVPSKEAHLRIVVEDPPILGVSSGVGLVRLQLDGELTEIPASFGKTLPLGQHKLVVTAQDNLGNTSEVFMDVVVGDLLPPTLVAPPDDFKTRESTVVFRWAHPTEKLFSLEGYELLISTQRNFEVPQFAFTTSSNVPVSIQADDALASLEGLTVENRRALLITTVIPERLDGTLGGVWTTPFIALPANARRITGFQATQTLGQGQMRHEFSFDGINFRPISELEGTRFTESAIQFRAILARPSLSDESPTLTGIQFTIVTETRHTEFICFTFRGKTFCFKIHDEFHIGTEPRSVAATDPNNTLQGLEVADDIVRLVTTTLPETIEGTLSGVWTGPPVPVLPEAFRIVDIRTDFELNQGTVTVEFTSDGVSFKPIQQLEALDLSTVTAPIQIRATLSRASLTDKSPTFAGVSFTFLLPPPTEQTASLPEEGLYFWKVRSSDFLGRVSAPSEERSLTFDKTPPTITISSPTAGQRFVATRDKIRIGFTVTDNLDPTPRFEAALVQREDRGSPRGLRSTLIPVTTGQEIEPLSIDDGLWELQVSATDFALNSAIQTSGLFEVIHDIQPPRTTIDIGEPNFSGPPAMPSTTTVFVTKATPIRIASEDDLVEVGDRLGLGVAFQEATLRGLTVQRERIFRFDNPDPRQGQVFVSTLAATKEPDGLYALEFHAEDIIGNREEVKITTIAVDNTAPQTEIVLGIPRFITQEGVRFITSKTPISFEAFDVVVGSVASGVRLTEFSVDGASFTVAPASFTLTEGIHKVAFRSIDNLGNTEELTTVELRVDDTPPLTDLISTEKFFVDEFGRNYANPFFQYRLDARDPVVKDVASGVAFTRFSTLTLVGTQDVFTAPDPPLPPLRPYDPNNPLFALDEGIKRVDFQSQDNVQNLELLKGTTIFVDATPPISTLVVSSPSCIKEDGFVVSSKTQLVVDAADPQSRGVASGVFQSFFKENGGQTLSRDFRLGQTSPFFLSPSKPDGFVEVSFFSVDNIANVESPKTRTLVLDNTPPKAFFLSPTTSTANPGLCKLLGGTQIRIIGTVTDKGTHPAPGGGTGAAFDHFESYTLEFGFGAEPSFFTLITSSVTNRSLESEALGVWDATSLPEGVYTLRLTTRDCVHNETVTTIQVIVSRPRIVLSLGKIGNGAGEFNQPSYIAIDPNTQDIWVSDTNNDRIQKFASSGTFVAEINPTIGSPSGKLNKPTGVVVDSQGDVWIADRNNNRALKFSKTGSFLLELQGTNFNKPHGLAIDSQGNIFVADRNNDRVQKFSPEGTLLLTINTGVEVDFNKPQGVLAVDHLNQLYITDRNNDRVLVFSSTGGFVRQLGGGSGSGPGQFNKPDGIALNGLAFAYVADQNNSRVQKFDPFGNVVLIFNMPQNQDEVLNHPGGLATDKDGNLWVADSNNGKVKKFAPEGDLIVIASQDQGAPKDQPAKKFIVKVQGGAVFHAKGAKVDIPAQALPQDMEIMVAASQAPPKTQGLRVLASGTRQEMKTMGQAVEYGPSGTQFSQPVTLTLPYDPKALGWAGEDDLTLAYFNPSSSEWEPLQSAVDKTLKVVRAQTTHFSLYAVMAPVSANPSFQLGEVYSFPNPARSGEKPTLHIEAGIADLVNIKIYDVAGELVHETTLSGTPQLVPDPSGISYSYEYTWDQNIPTGVYLYVVTAQKGTEKIRRTGRFSVVR